MTQGHAPVASVLVSSDTQYNNLKTLTKIAKQSIQSQNLKREINNHEKAITTQRN